MDLRLTEVGEDEILPLRRSLADFLSPECPLGRFEILPRVARAANSWYQGAVSTAGGVMPPWWTANPIIDSNPVVLYRVRHAYYMPRYGVVISSTGHLFDIPLRQARYGTPDLTKLPYVARRGERAYLTPTHDLPTLQRAIVTCPWGAVNNYGHFLLDCLSSVAAIAKLPALSGYPTVFPPLHPWQARHLELVGREGSLQLQDELYFVDDLVFSSSMATFLHHPNINYRTLKERQLERVGNSDLAFTKIYLARQDTTRRPFLTDMQVREELVQLGYEIIYPERYSVDEQINIFTTAEIIIGCAGAAFANVLYCQRNPKVIEIIPLRMVVPRMVAGTWVYRICALIGCAWRPYFCDKSWASEGSADEPAEDRAELDTVFELDLDDFMAHVRNISNEACAD